MSSATARIAVANHSAARLGLSGPRPRRAQVGRFCLNSDKRCGLQVVRYAQAQRVVATGASEKSRYCSSSSSIVLTASSKPIGKRTSVISYSASSSATAEAPQDNQKSLQQTLFLGMLFALWYFFNIWFNIFNKQVLKVTATPFLSTAAQFGVGVVFVGIMWGTRIQKPPNITRSQIIGIIPLAIVHTLGNLLTNVSLGKVAVSFTHTIKAMEPFFSVALSSIFLGTPVTTPVVLSLIPIVAGVALASFSEASFNWAGFGAAMGSNLTFQSRNVLSKKLMAGDTQKGLDNINLFSIITIMSFILMTPIAFAVEGMKLTPSALAAEGLDPQSILTKLLLTGLFFHSYQQVSFMILERVSPVTHSVGNCLKRVIVIVASVIFFQNPVSPLNALGTAIALSGVFLYSQVKRIQAKKSASAQA